MLITLKIDVVDMVRLCVVQEVAGCVLVAQDKVAGGRPIPVCALVAQEVVGPVWCLPFETKITYLSHLL